MIVNPNDNIGSILNANYEVLHQNLHQIKNNFMVYEKEEQLTEHNIRVSYDLDKKYGITINKKFREELIDMCNLSEGVFESGRMKGLEQGILQGIEQGMEQGMKQGIAEGISKGVSKRNTEVAMNMLKLNMDIDTISKATELSVDKILELQGSEKASH